MAAREVRVLEAVTAAEIESILSVTDALGLHRESVVIPLPKRRPGGVRRRPDGKLEIVVDAERPFEEWLSGLEQQLRALG
jgi:hypothetical protein